MGYSLNIIEVDNALSTNTLLASMAGEVEHGTVVLAREQSAGRGQRGNTWEAEPGKNITMSILLKPILIQPKYMHIISEIVSLLIVKVLRRHIAPSQGTVSIKWPNDIYVDDKKICGILVENSLMGDYIAHSIVGIGLNVNQLEFRSDAPNPVSIGMLTGQELPVGDLARDLAADILAEMSNCQTEDPTIDATHRDYQKELWRREGYHMYATPDGCRFKARIAGVEKTGILTLEEEDGTRRDFAFKEVAAVL